MTPYAWRCSVCESSNSAEANVCCTCGVPAEAKGTEILAARKRLAAAKEAGEGVNAGVGRERRSTGLDTSSVVAFFGVVLIAIALVSLAHGHWPGFLPPQLDALEAAASFLVVHLGALPTFLIGVGGGTILIAIAAVLPRSSSEA